MNDQNNMLVPRTFADGSCTFEAVPVKE